mmetsp:Transcript_18477/g.27114  ORF Transcript_18477/g.27114 Transcript_18477/m.27114 type:complete len:83 (-) Transcript_18477:41-289(-)
MLRHPQHLCLLHSPLNVTALSLQQEDKTGVCCRSVLQCEWLQCLAFTNECKSVLQSGGVINTPLSRLLWLLWHVTGFAGPQV